MKCREQNRCLAYGSVRRCCRPSEDVFSTGMFSPCTTPYPTTGQQTPICSGATLRVSSRKREKKTRVSSETVNIRQARLTKPFQTIHQKGGEENGPWNKNPSGWRQEEWPWRWLSCSCRFFPRRLRYPRRVASEAINGVCSLVGSIHREGHVYSKA